MKNIILKKAVSVVALVAMMTGTFSGNIVKAEVCTASNSAVCSEHDAVELDVMLYDRLDAEKINSSTKLSTEQKAELIKANDEAKAYFDQIDALLDEVDKKYEEIMAGTETLYEKIDSIIAENSDIWDKFDESEFTDEDLEKTEEELIKGSKVLTKEEKEILLSDLDEIKQYESQIEEKYEKFMEATEYLDAEFDEAYKVIEKIFEDNGTSLNLLADELIVLTDCQVK